MTDTDKYDENIEVCDEYGSIDYITDSLECIAKHEVFRLSQLLTELNESNRLCSDEGRSIVAEFGFKGNIKAVIYKLEEYIRDIEQNGITDLHRIEICNRFITGVTIASSEEDANPYKALFKKAIKDNDLDAIFKYAKASRSYVNEQHENKTCLCYTNED